LGVAGILLMIAFLVCWARAAAKVWRGADSNVYGRAASIASAAILVHSLVDFPLRTASIAAVFAMCLASMVQARVFVPAETSEPRRPRHVIVTDD
jgi:hypothetical protein